MLEITVKAIREKLDEITESVNNALMEHGCSMRDVLRLDVVIDEIFANIAGYAYAPGTGDVTIRLSFENDPPKVTLTFIDSGKPFDPLKRDDPDTKLDAAHRQIGGLGIFVVKKTMDEVGYRYADGQNILTVAKYLGGGKCER